MKQYKNESYEGERALFKVKDALIEGCEFHDGESPLKESRNLVVNGCSFKWKYPLWYAKNIKCYEDVFDEGARAGIWYTEDSSFTDCTFIAPKLFRKCKNITISNGDFVHGDETFWWNENLVLSYVRVVGAYAFMKTKGIKGSNVEVEGGYAFDGCEDLELDHCKLITKDAFWNCKNVVCRDSYIECEYFGWNSENVTLINCTVKSHQGFCYMKNIKLINCEVIESDLTFEYCENIDAEIHSELLSIKNPISGRIICDGYGELILDDDAIDHSKTEIIVR